MFIRSSVRRVASFVAGGVLAAAGFMSAQEQPQPGPMPQYPSQQSAPAPSNPDGSWTPVGQDPQGQQPNGPYQAPPQSGPAPTNQMPSAQAPYGANGPYATQGPYSQQRPYNQQAYQQPSQPVPPQLTVPAGTFITVRVNQVLSSDHNQPGDGFSGTLVQPLVVNGVVIAEPGQTIAGQVVEAQKAGRVEGVARLKVQLTELTLVDGQQLPLRTALASRTGGTSVGRDAAAIAGTTGLGAAIGAAAGWGTGAAIGAGAGAVAGTLGVLLTRGQPSIISPEQILTFRIEAPISIDTTRSAQAFRYVQPNEYDRPVYNQQPAPYSYNAPVIAAAPVPYYYGYGYPYYYPYYQPGFSVFFGSGYYGRGWYGGRGYYRGGFHHR